MGDLNEWYPNVPEFELIWYEIFTICLDYETHRTSPGLTFTTHNWGSELYQIEFFTHNNNSVLYTSTKIKSKNGYVQKGKLTDEKQSSFQ